MSSGKTSLLVIAGSVALLGIVLGGCGKKLQDEGIGGAVASDRPTIMKVTYNPLKPRPGERLSAEAEILAGGSRAVTLSYHWTRNGQALGEIEGKELDTKGFKKGDHIGLTIIPQDSSGKGNVFNAPEITIGNQRPVVAQMALEPTGPIAGSDLSVVAQGGDSDGDAVTLRYQWLRNGQPVAEAKGATFPGSLLRRGDVVEAHITPWDGEEAGDERVLGPFKVLGPPPRILSQPPSEGFEGGVFAYRIVASNPGGGGLTFSLVQGPVGMTVGSNDGMLRWNLPGERGKAYPVTVRVTNEEGAWIEQGFTIRY
jgi:Putative Ig domain